MAIPPDLSADFAVLGEVSSFEDDSHEHPDVLPLGNGQVAEQRRAVQEITVMADRLSLLVQDIRNTSVETDQRLRKIEKDLELLLLEI